MKYKHGTRRRAKEYEYDWVKKWQDDETFKKSVENRSEDQTWVFYDGPPFLTGTPHHGHLLISSLKDTMGRYYTMQGNRVERTWGWDCHGLPAEVFVEKKLGISDKKEIGTKISVKDYVKECRAAMVKTGTEWEDTVDRLGRWVEFKGAYKTMDNEYMESVWWAFKTLHEKGKLYEGEKVLMHCTKDATPLSKSEVTMDPESYKTVTDPSAYVKFKLEDGRNVLAWTTTPWTLSANLVLAVHKDYDYVEVEVGDEQFVMAKSLLEKVLTDEKHKPLEYKVLNEFKGGELVGKKYQPLNDTKDYLDNDNTSEKTHTVMHADFVSSTDGTGVVHIAPAYGEDDYEMCKKENVPLVMTTDEHGFYTAGRWQGKNVWGVNKEIAKTLQKEGVVWKLEYLQHEYPHCHRCNTKLMYRAHPSWFMDTQTQKPETLREKETTAWVPSHLRDGRYHNILEQAPDWNLSRDRYWATPLPVWQGEDRDGKQHTVVMGSYDDFEKYTGERLDDYHLPNVMDVAFELDGVTYHHVGKVLDCWFESASMPFAQFHYPFENKEKFEKNYPADFITEAIDQTRGWFSVMMTLNVGLFGKAPFKNVLCTGLINAADGRKMSKKLKNYTDPMELMDKYSADSFRFLMMSSPLVTGENFALDDKDVSDVARKLSMVWNMYDFFTMYAEVDNWEYDGNLEDPMDNLTNPLDVWVVSRLHALVNEVEDAMNVYDLQSALKPVLPFIDDASNWFVRRSRRRFWKSEDDSDKNDAYKTLHYVLTRLSYVLAPFTPFLADELHEKMTGDKTSVHLKDWLKAGKVNQQVMDEMDEVRGLANQGLSMRAKAGVKVRQPLASVTVEKNGEHVDFEPILLDELNVKQVKYGDVMELDLEVTPELKAEGMMREAVRYVQNARKQAGLSVDDRIVLSLKTEDEELKEALKTHEAELLAETLATLGKTNQNQSEVKVDKKMLTLALEKQA